MAVAHSATHPTAVGDVISGRAGREVGRRRLRAAAAEEWSTPPLRRHAGGARCDQ